ncbi:hypothetical protein PHLGIDRAFT_105108 [Phlebiopsis gigantea 11061_1 CR5-6]|uniref:Zinc/iron permease n=1 Tax=Phlebiopsis gigantea (strain 11061_1 CR5-6) TaxID=745531 RepID=A0A0C3S8Z6_PHLG1|nr:hypothetical protein PHLGIDRAFT_105108 [Phlebiopsis gigantea 11061_1 CR5-6]
MESTPTPVAVQKAQAVLDDTIPTKFTVSLGIFLLSLFAVSFPALSKRAKFLRIPSIVFFLGKHFGTGVILSTAFVHLLPDAFKQLQSRWTGFIMCVAAVVISRVR